MRSRGAASTISPNPSRNVGVSSTWNTSCAQPSSPTSAASNSNAVTIPMFDPAPRTAQKRSGRVSASVRTIDPSASTSSAARRWSIVRPCSRARKPMPPAVASPPTPTPPESPDEIAQPCSPSAAATSAQRAPGPIRTSRRSLVEHLDRVEVLQVDDDSAVVRAAAADPVAAAAHRERGIRMPACERDRVGHLRGGVGLQHDARCAPAHVGGTHGLVREVAGLDGAQPRGHVVVGDTGSACRDGHAGTAGCRDRAAPRALGPDELTDGGRHLLAERLQGARIVRGEDEGADAVLDRHHRQAVGPGAVLHRPDVQQSADLAGITPDRGRSLVDRRVAAIEIAGLQVAERGQPAVALASGERQHARLVGADPDRHVVCRARAALRAVHPVVFAVGERAAPLARVPQGADHVDRVLERRHGLSRGQPPAAHRLDRVPEAAGAQREIEAATGEQVQARGGSGDDSGRTQRHVEHVGGDPDAVGPGRDEGHERPRVEERRLVRVVLEGHQVEAGRLRDLRQRDRGLRVRGGRGDEGAEFERVSVIHRVTNGRVTGGIPARSSSDGNGFSRCRRPSGSPGRG